MRGQCQLCEGMIINPVCVRCLDKVAKQFFLRQRDYYRVHELVEDLSLFNREGISCILCKKKNAVCSTCFSKEASYLVKEKGLSEQFMHILALDLDKKPL